MNTLKLESDLAKMYEYKPLNKQLSGKYRKIFEENIPSWLKINGDPNCRLKTFYSVHFATGYDRIVIGDYGAFIEINPQQIIQDHIIIKRGQEYRIDEPKYARNVKYHWFTVDDGSDIKIYYQMRTVNYADYQVDKYYVSVHEVEEWKYGAI